MCIMYIYILLCNKQQRSSSYTNINTVFCIAYLWKAICTLYNVQCRQITDIFNIHVTRNTLEL